MTLNRTVAAALLMDAEAVVVELVPAPYEFHRYQRVGKDILLILDEGDRPLVGDAQHSFTLSRTP